MNDATELSNALAHHYGSENIYRHPFNRNFLYTDGVRTFAQNAGNGAYWLLDILATEPKVRQGVATHGFVVVVLDVNEGTAVLRMARDYNSSNSKFDTPVYTRKIDFTDCPDGMWKFYIVGGVMMLPSEY